MENQKVKLVGKIEKNAVSQIQISIKEWQDKSYIDIRTWVLSATGVQVPTKLGCSIPVGQIDELLEIFGKLKEAVKSF